MRRVWGWLAVTVLALTWSAVEVPRIAQAAGTCGFGGNFFNGYYQSGKPTYQHTGASSYVVVRNGALCRGVSGFGNFSNAWVMIAGSGSRDWGQVGFELTSGQPLRWFAQFSSDEGLSTWYSPFGVTNQIGTRHAFRVLYDPATSRLKATIDAYTVFRSGFDPKTDWGGQPWSPQFFAETGHRESDVPGRPTARTAYSAMGVQRLSDGKLVSIPCILSAATDSSRWGRQSSGCTAFSVWTT